MDLNYFLSFPRSISFLRYFDFYFLNINTWVIANYDSINSLKINCLKLIYQLINWLYQLVGSCMDDSQLFNNLLM